MENNSEQLDEFKEEEEQRLEKDIEQLLNKEVLYFNDINKLLYTKNAIIESKNNQIRKNLTEIERLKESLKASEKSKEALKACKRRFDAILQFVNAAYFTDLKLESFNGLCLIIETLANEGLAAIQDIDNLDD